MLDRILRKIYLWRFYRAATRNGKKSICFGCFKNNPPEVAHWLEVPYKKHVEIGGSVAVINLSRSIHILCEPCQARIDFVKRCWLYRMWFEYFSGFPYEDWAAIKIALQKEFLKEANKRLSQ